MDVQPNNQQLVLAVSTDPKQNTLPNTNVIKAPCRSAILKSKHPPSLNCGPTSREPGHCLVVARRSHGVLIG
jgi:hypothetical protein